MDIVAETWRVSDLHKSTKEAHIHGGLGTSLGDLNMLFSSLVSGELVQLCLGLHGCATSSDAILKSLLLLILPQMAVLTSLVEPRTVFLVNGLAALIAGLGRSQFIRRSASGIKSVPLTSWALCAELTSRSLCAQPRGFITRFRAYLMFYTMVTILAVDFDVFPKRFAKTESFGTGLMDVGVGCFVVVNGASWPQTHSRESMVKQLAAPFVLFALGVIRLMTTIAVNYQEHASEYGRDWNFFFTLAAIRLLSVIVCPQSKYRLALGAVVMVIHQALLSLGGMAEVVLTEKRGSSFWSRNKEGLLSLPGYYALFLLSSGVAQHITHSKADLAKQSPRGATQGLVVWFAQLWAAGFILWPLLHITQAYIQPISRRACNAPYIIWMLALFVGMACMDSLLVFVSVLVSMTPLEPSKRNNIGSSQTSLPRAGFQAAEMPVKPAQISSRGSEELGDDLSCGAAVVSYDMFAGMEAGATPGPVISPLNPLSKNMLLVFLIANLMTGAVNLSTNTLVCSPWVARGIILFYTAVLIWFAWVLVPRAA